MSTDLRTFGLTGTARNKADKISDKLDRALQRLEYTCAYSDQLNHVLGTMSLPGLQEMHTYALAPASYNLIIAAGAAKHMADSDTWTMPMVISIYQSIQNTIQAMTYFEQILQQVQNAVKMHAQEPWYTWAARAVQKTTNWSRQIVPLCENALARIEELIGPEKLDQLKDAILVEPMSNSIA